jgi:putative transposase
MPNTYSQLPIHCVFAVKNRDALLINDVRQEMFRYISGIIESMNQRPLAVNGWYDHVHILYEMSPSISVSKTMEIVKANSSKWINSRDKWNGRFNWQGGFGAFGCNKKGAPNVAEYIFNQEKHHRKKSFRTEYLEMLQEYEIAYADKYLFDFNVMPKAEACTGFQKTNF